jgi:hypothetical protein
MIRQAIGAFFCTIFIKLGIFRDGVEGPVSFLAHNFVGWIFGIPRCCRSAFVADLRNGVQEVYKHRLIDHLLSGGKKPTKNEGYVPCPACAIKLWGRYSPWIPLTTRQSKKL